MERLQASPHSSARAMAAQAMDTDDDDVDDDGGRFINPVPVIHARASSSSANARRRAEGDESVRDAFDAEEIFEHVRDINDPEHPYSLEQVRVERAHALACLGVRSDIAHARCRRTMKGERRD